jgi:hypothetical protein
MCDWCCVGLSFGVIGPYFFEEDRRAVTVNSDRYVNMLRNFLVPALKRRGINPQTIWFQQDGATAHTKRVSMDIVQEMFPRHVISKHGDLPWPACSADLSVCDCFLCGYLRAKVFINRPRTTDEQKVTIQQEIAAIPTDMVRRAMENFKARLQECVQKGGKHLDDIIFKTK